MQQSLQTQTDDNRHFRVALVEKATILPQGAEGDNWCYYVLESGYSTVTGWRRGSLQEITQHVIRYTEELNARSDSGSSLWRLRRKQITSG